MILCNILQVSKMNHILITKNNSNNNLIQKSSILAYYFIKFGLLENPNKFLKKFKLNTIWTDNKIREIYDISLKVLKKKIFNFNSSIKVKSLRMTYNNIVCFKLKDEKNIK